MIQYTMIGSGTLVPDADRGPACHLLKCGGLRIAFDLGFGALHRLTASGLDHAELDAVAITHRHQDHIADLLPLLFATHYRPDRSRQRPLTIVGYPELSSDLEGAAALVGDWLSSALEGMKLEAADARSAVLELGDARVEIESRSVPHTPEAVGYRIHARDGDEERLLAYTGDTEESDVVVSLARDADVMISECSAPDDAPVGGHMTPGGVGRVAAAAGVAGVLLCHVYPALLATGEDAILAAVRAHYDGPVTLGRDGLVVDL